MACHSTLEQGAPEADPGGRAEGGACSMDGQLPCLRDLLWNCVLTGREMGPFREGLSLRAGALDHVPQLSSPRTQQR